jgi:hypothetical protein
MLKTSTPAKLIAAAAQLPSPLLRTLVERVIACAAENADDTVYNEDNQVSWDGIFHGSLVSLLCDRLDRTFHEINVDYRHHVKSQRISDTLARDAGLFFKSHGYVA